MLCGLVCGLHMVDLDCLVLFFFNDTATTEIYTLSLHDALPIFRLARTDVARDFRATAVQPSRDVGRHRDQARFPKFRVAYRSEEHTSELQSQSNLVCRLLLEKKKNGMFCSNPELWMEEIDTPPC